LFKAYVVAAYIVWKLSSLYISEENSPFAPPVAVAAGYVLSIIVLSFVAGIRMGRKQNKAAVRTLVFVVIGVVFLSISFQAVSILRQITFLADVLINGLVLCYALSVRRSQKTRALTYWIWGCLINLIREIGLGLCNYWTPPLGNVENNLGRTDFWGLFYSFPSSSFMEIYWLGYLMSGVLYVSGIILIIQEQRAKDQFSLSPNTAMFVALGFLASMILMGISFLRLEHAELLPALAINGVVIYFCFGGFRHLKSKAFVLLASAAILAVARIVGVYLLDWYHNRVHNGGIATAEQWLLELLLLGSIVAIVFWGAGIIFIIQRIRIQRT